MKRSTSLVLAALLPVFAGAQQGNLDQAKQVAKQAGAPPAALADDGGKAVKKVEGSATAPDGGRGVVPAPDTYTIRPGDTLWDLSGRFLNNPWYWPKVWSYNPDIANPHWIEPGALLRFYPSAEEAPSRVEPLASTSKAIQVEPGQAAEEPEIAAPRELDDLSRADMKAPAPIDMSDEVAVSGPYKIGFVPPKSMMVRRDTFVTQHEVDESGSIVAAFEEKIWLSTLDKAYAHFRNPAELVPGETYVVYRTERAIHHPITKELLGYQTKILGTAKVTRVDAKAATLTIGQTIEPIERGDLLGPWAEKLLRPVTQRANSRELEGRIVAAQVDILSMLGEQHIVFIDKGKADGVEEGNVFRVVRSGDQYARDTGSISYDPDLPKEVVGDLMVIDVKEGTSTAIVTRSLTDLAIGDRIEARAGGN